jgi:hypothetical protein
MTARRVAEALLPFAAQAIYLAAALAALWWARG